LGRAIPSVGIGGGIHHHERETEAIGDRVPVVVVGEVESLVGRVEKPEAFAGVVEVAGESAGDGQPMAVTGREGRGFLTTETRAPGARLVMALPVNWNSTPVTRRTRLDPG
jgi:hypothetical protein